MSVSLIHLLDQARKDRDWPMVAILAAALQHSDPRTVAVPLIGQTRTETPRTEPTLIEPYGRARCGECEGLIAAYGYTREAVEVTGDPAAPATFLPGRAEFTDWRHSMLPRPGSQHDAYPWHGTIVKLRPPFADARPGSDGDTRDWPDEL